MDSTAKIVSRFDVIDPVVSALILCAYCDYVCSKSMITIIND